MYTMYLVHEPEVSGTKDWGMRSNPAQDAIGLFGRLHECYQPQAASTTPVGRALAASSGPSIRPPSFSF